MTAQSPAAADPAIIATANERPALGPWARAARKLWADKAAMIALAVFILIVVACALAPLYANYIAHTDPFTSNVDGDDQPSTARQVALLQPPMRGLAWAHPHRPDLGYHQLLPGRRQPGPRRHGPPVLWRAQFTVHRRHLHRHLPGAGRAHGPGRGVLRRHRRYRAIAHPRRDLGLSRSSCSPFRCRSC